MKWKDILQAAQNNPAPPKRVEKTEKEWADILTAEQYRVTRLHGTERPFSGEYCEAYSAGIYKCVCCGTKVFDSNVKFNSGTGWPSFAGPASENVVKYKSDNSHGLQRVEVLCNVCDAHLGHVFPDGPQPTGLRFCINSVSLKKETTGEISGGSDLLEMATLGSGCFWCTEAVLDQLEGVTKVISGYAGGITINPTYPKISGGNTGHAEVVQVTFNPQVISYADILRVFFATHNPTSLNRQGADVGSQYRSIILYHNETQQETARELIREMQGSFDKPIVTEIKPFTTFYEAEENHQNYYRDNPEYAYCQMVINPKLQKMRARFGMMLKKTSLDV
jgi:peptide methionine sulfoxide reductase msrA/msrB